MGHKTIANMVHTIAKANLQAWGTTRISPSRDKISATNNVLQLVFFFEFVFLCNYILQVSRLAISFIFSLCPSNCMSYFLCILMICFYVIWNLWYILLVFLCHFIMSHKPYAIGVLWRHGCRVRDVGWLAEDEHVHKVNLPCSKCCRLILGKFFIWHRQDWRSLWDVNDGHSQYDCWLKPSSQKEARKDARNEAK